MTGIGGGRGGAAWLGEQRSNNLSKSRLNKISTYQPLYYWFVVVLHTGALVCPALFETDSSIQSSVMRCRYII